jgi:hypothetical protein
MSFLKPMNPIKKTISKILIVSLIVPILFFAQPQKTNAQWPVFDVPTEAGTWMTSILQGSQFAKEFVGDSVANFIAKTIIQRLTAQTVNWINSGFKGNPAFVTNPDQFFLNVGDNIASHYLSMQGPLNALCSPFKAQVRLALVKNYLQETSNNYTCTLGTIEQNFDSFTRDFNQGGWDAWFNVTQNNQSNPYGTYLDAKNQLSIEIGNQQIKYQKQLDWGKGILSYERCKKGATKIATGVGLDNLSTLADGGAIDSADFSTDCAPSDKETITPGSVINDQLTKALGSTWSNLEASDEINEVVGALMQQLVSNVVGGISSGLRGLSDGGSGTASSAGSPRTFLQQMVDSTSPTSAESTAFTAGQKSIVPSDLGGTAAPTEPVPPPPSTAGALPVVDVRIVPSSSTSVNPVCPDPTNPSCTTTP